MVNTIIHTPTNHNLVIPSRFQETNLTYSLTDSNLEPTEEKEVKNEEIPKKEEEKPIGTLITTINIFKLAIYS